MFKFKKKPLEIEAIQFLDNAECLMELSTFIKGQEVDIKRHKDHGSYLIIKTLEGDMKANEYDYIIKGVNGEYYPCKPDIFEKSYDIVSSKDITFGEALEAMKKGKRVARKGWNGKDMFIFLFDINKENSGIKEGYAMHMFGYPIQPCIAMKTANDLIQVGWLASQADMLSNDWRVV